MQEDYDSQPGSPGPSKRRRYSRVSRACNECRLRKIRCNGRQPCEPCEDFERHCTFTSTKGQKVAGAPRTKILEDRLRRAKSLIAKLRAQNPTTISAADISNVFDSPPGSPSSVSDTTGATDESTGEHLESLMDGRGHLLLNQKSATYYGGGSSFAFLQKTQQLFSPDVPPIGNICLESPQSAISELFDSPLWEKQAIQDHLSPPEILPARRTALELLEAYFKNALPLFQFLHEPTFRLQVDRIYGLDPLAFGELDRDFLPLFHSVIAIGYLYKHDMHQRYGCKASLDQAHNHFSKAHRMTELNRCRDILGLQTIINLALFLISTCRVATAHTLIGLAVSASLRMGLHSQSSCSGLTSLSREIKIRVFWIVVKLDIYSSILLGLPMMLDLTYVDQFKPSTSCQDYTDEETGGFTSIFSRRSAAASAHFLELLMTMRKMLKHFYPKTDEEVDEIDFAKKFAINDNFIDGMKEEFRSWREGLVDVFGSSEGQENMSSILYEMEMVHNVGHIILYRPYLHYLTKTKDENPPDPRLLKCATSCVKISRFTIIRSEEMFSQGFLEPAAWHSTYILFLSIVALIYFLATQHGNREYMAIQKEAERGIRLLHGTCCQHTGSRKFLVALKALIAKQSNFVDLDIDKLSHGVKPLCQTKTPASDEHQKLQQTPEQYGNITDSQWVDGRAVHMAQRLPMQTSNSRQFVYRSQSYDNPAGAASINPPTSPFYQSQYGAYGEQNPAWSRSTATLNTTADLHLSTVTFPYQTGPAQSIRINYGESETDHSHANLHPWSFPADMRFDQAGSRQEPTVQPPTPYGLSPEEARAFFGNNHGQ
ncbi:hypothetical protein LTR84_012167 [Exophiala bonariae]|uniref:Zn(2)-C6 fungal-type domain-containing protein n=1 Tax=Exophiala bonariae TaxID=1690606 RepID=A0AAV9NJ41_9EURO|nr:hypothetical protein LTR84_012167 [Exophiala bonariae]